MTGSGLREGNGLVDGVGVKAGIGAGGVIAGTGTTTGAGFVTGGFLGCDQRDARGNGAARGDGEMSFAFHMVT